MQMLFQRNADRHAEGAYGISVFISDVPIMLRDLLFVVYADCLAQDI